MPAPLQDTLLDKLSGNWAANGTAGDHPLMERVFADWVLHHQFLRLYTRESTGRYESELYIGYDPASDRYVAHMLDVLGGRASETLGFGLRTGDQLQIVFDRPTLSVRHTLNWSTKESSWQYQIEVKDHSSNWHTVSTKTMKKLSGGGGGRSGRGHPDDGDQRPAR